MRVSGRVKIVSLLLKIARFEKACLVGFEGKDSVQYYGRVFAENILKSSTFNKIP
jgi:hypothetical protein